MPRSAQDIVNALLRHRGNVLAAAEDLAMSRKNLYQRIGGLGLDLPAIRRTDLRRVVPLTRYMGDMRPPGIGTGHETTVAETASGPLLSGSVGRNLRPMQAAAKDEDAQGPIRAMAPRQRTIRLRPDFQDRLREAKLEFLIRFRIETDENLILDQFFEECFTPWLQAKLQPQAEPKRKPKAKEEK